MIKQGMYVIAVPNLDRSAAFYRDALGFEIHQIGDPGWRMYSREDCRIMAGECPGAMAPDELGDHSYYAYLVVDDLETHYERAKANGAEILKHPRVEPWGMKEFAIRTVDGHRIMIGQDLDTTSDSPDDLRPARHQSINFDRKFDLFEELWTPKVIAEMNDYQFKLVRIRGDFIWHQHGETDEAFVVLAGNLRIDFRDGSVDVGPGEMYVVPKGVEHKPFAAEEARLLLIEPRGVLNTGEEGGERTAENDVWI